MKTVNNLLVILIFFVVFRFNLGENVLDKVKHHFQEVGCKLHQFNMKLFHHQHHVSPDPCLQLQNGNVNGVPEGNWDPQYMDWGNNGLNLSNILGESKIGNQDDNFDQYLGWSPDNIGQDGLIKYVNNIDMKKNETVEHNIQQKPGINTNAKNNSSPTRNNSLIKELPIDSNSNNGQQKSNLNNILFPTNNQNLYPSNGQQAYPTPNNQTGQNYPNNENKAEPNVNNVGKPNNQFNPYNIHEHGAIVFPDGVEYEHKTDPKPNNTLNNRISTAIVFPENEQEVDLNQNSGRRILNNETDSTNTTNTVIIYCSPNKTRHDVNSALNNSSKRRKNNDDYSDEDENTKHKHADSSENEEEGDNSELLTPENSNCTVDYRRILGNVKTNCPEGSVPDRSGKCRELM